MQQPTSPLDRPLAVTFFKHHGAAAKQEMRLSLRGMVERLTTTTRDQKTKLPWLKLARFGNHRTAKNSLRSDENMIGVSGIEGDYDHAIMTVDEAIQVMQGAGLAGIIYTSPSHTEDTPRWRILCPLSRDYDPPERDRFTARLNGLFLGALSAESFTRSQSYYFGSVNNSPSHRVETIDGEYIDIRADLDEAAIGRPQKQAPSSIPVTGPDHDPGPYCRAVLKSALDRVRNAGDGQKHHTLRGQARLLGGFAHAGGWSRDYIAGALVQALPASAKDLKAARVTAEYGFDQGVTQPLEVPASNIVRFPAPEPPADDDPNYWAMAQYDEPGPEDQVVLVPAATVEPATHVYDPWNALRPVRFPIECVPANMRAFVQERARTIGADPAAIAWACLSAASSAIDGRIRLKMKRHDNWSVPASIWLALVGLPSTKKTPIVSLAWHPLEKIQGRALDAHRRAMAEWKSLPKDEKAHTPEPKPPRRLISHDATMESIQEILNNQDRGLGILRDELAGWIGSLEKYAPGKGGAADRAFALQSYNGGSHVVDRVMRGTLSINNLLCAICGGIQPDRLRQFGDLADDGLWQRFIPIIVAPASLGTDEESQRSDAWEEIIDRLLRVAPDTRVELCEQAHAIRLDVQQRVFALEQSEVLGARFVGFLGKLAGLWGRLTLILHLIAEPGSQVVRVETADAARRLLFNSVLPNAARVYTAMGGAGGDAEATQSIAGYILTKRLSRVVMSDMTSNVRVCRGRSSEDVRKLLSPLEAGGWLMPEKEFAPTSWLVSQIVHERFADRADKEAGRRSAMRALIVGETDE